MTSPRRPASLLLIILALALALSACRPQTPAPTPPVTNSTAGETPGVTLAASTPEAVTPAASPTAARAQVILLAPPGADAALKQGAGQALQALAVENGLSFETVEALAPGELGGVRLLVVLPPDPGVEALAQAAQSTLIITMAIPLPGRLGRVSRILPADNAGEQAAFVAGYTAALVAADWRAGVLASNTPEGQRAQQAFINGAQFFCGLCKPAYPPFFTYPRAYALASPDDAAGLQAALAAIDEHDIDVLYVDTPLAVPAVLDALAAQGIKLIATVDPSEGAVAGWVTTLQPDPLQVLRSMAAQALTGSLPAEANAGLRFTQRDTTLLTDARLRLAEQVAADVAAGRIAPIPAE